MAHGGDTAALALAGRDEAWLKRQLAEQSIRSTKEVFLGELVDGELHVVAYLQGRQRERAGKQH